MTTWEVILQGSARADLPAWAESPWCLRCLLLVRCLRCLLLVMCTYPFAKKPLTLHLARGEGRERYFGCNLMHHKVLASSYQHLMAEAPARVLFRPTHLRPIRSR